MGKRSETSWCCVAFQQHFDAAGEVGFSMVVERWPSGEPKFLLRHQAVEMNGEPVDTAARVELVGQAIVHCCPWCGQRLDRRYGDRVDDLERPDYTLEAMTERFQT